ncbi:IBR/half ring-finger domain containing protein [Nitzschia inconspicua]|uniref:RBR-type E3 ubiquitin transferase n=1 Tax=Nitzschia inconspicua TaxID=303405 RepID=A0A9K3PG74_9STRA|nr:IBR/half ring-finger domain containing protein [Nitzschia inconspicua]
MEPRSRQPSTPDSDGVAQRKTNNPKLYPDVLSPRPVNLASSSSSHENFILAIHDVIVRSLRRRLWKAIQEDDKETALRTYQATLFDFRQWLQEEEDLRAQMQEEELKRQLPYQTGKINYHQIRHKGNHKRNLQHDDTAGHNSSLLKCCYNYEKELEQKFGGQRVPILETLMNPSEPFIADDFLSPYDRYDQPVRKDLPDPVKYAAEQKAIEDAARRKRRRARRPRVAFRYLIKRDDVPDIDASPTATSGDSSGVENSTKEDVFMTTPLHEAARLGAGNFVAILLAQGGDPNRRNGLARTALHTCAGGLTYEEQVLSQAISHTLDSDDRTSSLDTVPVSIQANFLPDKVLSLIQGPKTIPIHGNESQSELFGRLFRSAKSNKEKVERGHSFIHRKRNTVPIKPSQGRYETLMAERLDAALSILSWVQKDTGDGPSINAVDADGRTALHYASGMGRSDICMAILSDFGAILTIVDDVGARTPCEVAANQGHKELAAQLEARALLYVDPYGLDDDLMENIRTVRENTNSRRKLVPPFKWFETLSASELTKIRYKRVSQTRLEMSNVIDECTAAAKIKKLSSSSSDSSTNDTDVCIIDGNSHKATPATEGEITHIDFALNKCNLKQIFQRLQDSHIELFLSFHKWNVMNAVKAFRQYAFDAFSVANVPLPLPKVDGKSDEKTCQICYDDNVASEDWMYLLGCEHGFCKDCLSVYIQDCAQEKQPMYSITCPHHECRSLIAKHDIERLLENDSASLKRLYEASTENFVTASADFKFCPFPGCRGTVHRLLPSKFSSGRLDANILDYTGATCVAVRGSERIGDGCTLTYEGVEDLEYNNCHSTEQPPKAHRFCFACGGGVHWPLTCERLEQWNEKIREEIGEITDGTDVRDYNDLAQKIWIKANTRPCPSCHVNIEKNDGCNHMVCSNPQCLHEFCWICRKDWKLHSNATGGYFRCNIWEEGRDEQVQVSSEFNPFELTSEEGYGTAINSAREAWKTKLETNRFIHHYTRWEAHAESASLERKMQDSVCTRLAPLVEAAMAYDGSPLFNFGGQGLSFIHSAFIELLECRSVLRHSYAFSFLRYPTFSKSSQMLSHIYGSRKEKQNFERLQAELEVITEQMSDIVARSHLRATQVQISFLTAGAAEKRVELSNMVFQIYREERKEIEKYEKRKENEKKYRAKSPRGETPPSSGVPRPSLSEIMLMHQRPRDLQFDHNNVADALDGFVDRATRMDHHATQYRDLDALASEAIRMWACSLCTYMNDGGRICAMCGRRR